MNGQRTQDTFKISNENLKTQLLAHSSMPQNVTKNKQQNKLNTFNLNACIM